MTNGRREAGEELALVLTDYGLQRMNARVIAALLVTERETLTQGELAEELGVAAGSVSGAVKLVISLGLVERVPVPGSRREHYRLRDDAWAKLFSQQNQAIEAVLTAAREASEATEANSRARRRLEDMCDFYAYLLAELPALIERWNANKEQ